jgi:DNA-binding LacI/PurR family transcriptional regulator
LTALISMNESAIPGVMRAIANQNLQIPQDFSILVIASSARVAEMMTPPLTTFDIAAAESARMAVELLIRQLEGEEHAVLQKLLPCHLVVRGSTSLYPQRLDKSKDTQLTTLP